MNDLNIKFSSLTLHELHQYILNLESENKKLVNELTISSNLIYVLEKIAQSCQTGYSLLRKIEINKNCDCNEHLNEQLRKSLNHSIQDSNIWLDQYQSIKNSFTTVTDTENEQVIDLSDAEDSRSSARNLVNLFDQKQSINLKYNPRSKNQLIDTHSSGYCCKRSENVCYEAKTSSHNHEKLNHINRSFDSLEKASEQCGNNPKEDNNHMIYRSDQCNISWKMKPNMEQNTLSGPKQGPKKFYANSYEKSQRQGPGRPPNNEPRVLSIANFETNIWQISEQFGTNGCLPVLQTNNSTYDDLKRTKYSGAGRYRCPWPDCGYTPHFLRDLRRHMSKHTGDKKHKCDYPECDFITVWKTSLLQHRRKKHNSTDKFDTRSEK